MLSSSGVAQAQPGAKSAPKSAPDAAGGQQAHVYEDAVLDTPTGKLYGVLELPVKALAPYPVVLIIAGSGPTDHDGNTAVIPGSNNSLRYLAEGLAARGIASLRYDKRGVARSAGAGVSEAELRFDTFINDAVLWGRRLRGDKRFSSLVVAGHSEGSLIGMVAAQTLAADGFVSIAGVGQPAGQLIIKQMKGQLSPELLSKSEAITRSLEEGKTVADVPNELAALYRPSVQPYLTSWFKYDPAKEIAKLDAPVLITQGTHDIQVSVEDAKLLAAAKPSAKLLIVEKMNHVLKETPADPKQQAGSYGDPSLPVAPSLLVEMADFVKGIRKK
ncbi:MAG: alpha/beta hydrolase [Rubrivivax sp.]|nr:alpha/beta hydrolase [Pyrinomonadaceae bacterium]